MDFNLIPSNLRVPGSFAEFDSSQAQQGASLMPYKQLIFGQMLSSGTATANVPVKVTSLAQGKTLFGAGSMLAGMLEKHFLGNNFVETWVIPQSDNGSGVAATGSISFAGPATAAGTLNLYLGGRLVQVGVASGDTATTIAAAAQAAIAANADLQVVATVDGTHAYTVDFVHKHKGECGNGFDIRFNYQDGQALPAGVAVTITELTGGSANPLIASAIAAMGETQYNIIDMPYLDGTNMSSLEAELADRWGPIRQNDGVAISYKDDTHSNLGTYGNAKNSQFVSVFGGQNFLNPAYEVAAALGAVHSFYGSQDPARPFQTLVLNGILAPSTIDQFTLEERNLLLYDGISTLKVNDAGQVTVERSITTYKTNAAGAPDTAYLNLNNLLVLSYLRYDWNALVLRKYPRSKLAKDGTTFGAGQPVVTPKVMKAEAVARFALWEELGLVQGLNQFKQDTNFAINGSDPSRLDSLLVPNIMSQFIINASQFRFLL